MRKKFVETKNVKRLVAAINALIKRYIGIERFMLLFGNPRMGKTEAIIWLINHFFTDAVFVRCIKIMSARWLLEELVGALGLDPCFRSKDLFDQAKDALIGTDRLVIFDEIDYLTHDSKVIETIRDLNDLTNAPFVFVGMHQADRKLKRYPHLWGRFAQVVHFEPPDREDATSILTQILEVKVDESAIDLVCDTPNLNLSLIYRWGQRIEAIARSRGLERVSAEDLLNKNQLGERNGSKTNKSRIKLSA